MRTEGFMMDARYDSAGALRTIARGTGTLLAVFFLLAFLPKTLSLLSGTSSPMGAVAGREWEGQIMTAMFLTYVAGYVIGWWRSLGGGIVIILAALVVSVPFIVIQGHFNSLIFGLPIFIVGVLYVVLHVMESREKS
jgi:hypothetical protein